MRQLLSYLLAERGRMARVAAEVGVSPAYLSQVANGNRPVPVERAAELEKACAGQVPRWCMFPTNWHLIWPELVGAEGAPAVPQSPAVEAQSAA